MSTRILVVDDDASLAEMIGIMLESESYTPTLCHDGAKALDAFHEVNPDLVLLDLMLPGLVRRRRVETRASSSLDLKGLVT